MPKALAFAAVAALLVPLVLATATRATPRHEFSAAPLPARPTVVVELFSSEGCSSCPPADAYVADLDRRQPVDQVTVLALEFHVDYWDRLGWKDPFDSHEFAERQADYARAKGDARVFTPEVIVDGDAILPSVDDEAAFKSIRRASREPKAEVQIERVAPGEVSVVVRAVPGAFAADPSSVWLAVTESNLSSTVTAGENNGRVLAHAPVVRRLRKLGEVHAGAFQTRVPVALDAAWRPKALRLVAFVQAVRSKRIFGAAAVNLE